MGATNVIAQQGYYYLYALYFDYPINNAFFANEENTQRVREALWTVRRLEGMRAPYRKHWRVRLFTERDAVARFTPETVNYVLFQLRELVDQIGPPPGWSRGPLPSMEERRSRAGMPRDAGHKPQVPAPPGLTKPFPKPPIPIRLTG